MKFCSYFHHRLLRLDLFTLHFALIAYAEEAPDINSIHRSATTSYWWSERTRDGNSVVALFIDFPASRGKEYATGFIGCGGSGCTAPRNHGIICGNPLVVVIQLATRQADR